jgi:hypothetical protein
MIFKEGLKMYYEAKGQNRGRDDTGVYKDYLENTRPKLE